jgi:hypothetical protein
MNDLTQFDCTMLRSMGVAIDAENFRLEALWIRWRRENTHRDISACRGCGAETWKRHPLDCQHRALMLFSAAEPQHDRDITASAEPITQHEPPPLIHIGLTTDEIGAILLESINALSDSDRAQLQEMLRRELLDNDEE